jgi:hypothetical protein
VAEIRAKPSGIGADVEMGVAAKQDTDVWCPRGRQRWAGFKGSRVEVEARRGDDVRSKVV